MALMLVHSLLTSNQLRSKRLLSMSFCQDSKLLTCPLPNRMPWLSGSNLTLRRLSKKMPTGQFSLFPIQHLLTHLTHIMLQCNRLSLTMKSSRKRLLQKLNSDSANLKRPRLSATNFRFPDRHLQQIKTRSKEVISKAKPPILKSPTSRKSHQAPPAPTEILRSSLWTWI